MRLDRRAEARRQAADAAVTGRLKWVQARAEDLPAGLGTFTVAAFGQSFHWMNRDLVAATIRDMLRPGGAMVHISDVKTETRSVDGLPYPAVPYAFDTAGAVVPDLRQDPRGELEAEPDCPHLRFCQCLQHGELFGRTHRAAHPAPTANPELLGIASGVEKAAPAGRKLTSRHPSPHPRPGPSLRGK